MIDHFKSHFFFQIKRWKNFKEEEQLAKNYIFIWFLRWNLTKWIIRKKLLLLSKFSTHKTDDHNRNLTKKKNTQYNETKKKFTSGIPYLISCCLSADFFIYLFWIDETFWRLWQNLYILSFWRHNVCVCMPYAMAKWNKISMYGVLQ